MNKLKVCKNQILSLPGTNLQFLLSLVITVPKFLYKNNHLLSLLNKLTKCSIMMVSSIPLIISEYSKAKIKNQKPNNHGETMFAML
jgi:hypothetical protein